MPCRSMLAKLITQLRGITLKLSPITVGAINHDALFESLALQLHPRSFEP